MNRYTLLSIIAFFLFVQKGISQEITWMTWQQAVTEREKFFKENAEAIKNRQVAPKKIFIDVYTDWCGWCKKMDKSTFIDPAVVKYMNDHYYAVKLNAEMRDTITYDGHKFYNIGQPGQKGTHTLALSILDSKMSYPTYVIMDENMQRAAIFPGYKGKEAFLGILTFFGSNEYLSYKEYLDGMNKMQQPKGK